MRINSPQHPHRGGCDGPISPDTVEFPDTEVIPASPTEQPTRVEPAEDPIEVPNWPVKVPNEVEH